MQFFLLSLIRNKLHERALVILLIDVIQKVMMLPKTFCKDDWQPNKHLLTRKQVWNADFQSMHQTNH